MDTLSKKAIEKHLSQLEGWSYKNNTICKTYRFSDFDQALKAIHLVGDLAKSLNHHPDWSNSYTQLSLSITTKDIGGVSDLDFKFAYQTQALLKNLAL
ncbi:MAG: 4a-hydroxytetrahydrobiopterin dehydratase [Flavobacteriales bacterium]|jgi:4a-hydroxytetrahydrobiopterin dehydratase|nr:4a-hydroxytetrahydrobiopterin dehydratase [Flavobacteriales bacterium]